MGLTLPKVLVKTLKKLEEPSFQKFIEKLSVWEVRKEEYIKIPKVEITGKDPDHVAALINEYYKYAYGAEVTLAVLEDIEEKKVRKKLQCYLKKVKILGHGLGTVLYTDKVNFIEDHRSDLIGRITNVDPVLCDLRDQKLLTQEQYNNVMEKRTSQEKIRELCNIIIQWEDTGKYIVYKVLRKYNGKIIRDLEMEERMRRKLYSVHFRDRVTFIDNHRSDLIRRITYVDPVLCDLRDQKLLTQEQYNNVMEKRTSQEKMGELCDIIRHWEVTGKYTAYTVLRKYNGKIIRDMEKKKRIESNITYPHLQFFTGDHFVDRYRYHLTHNIKEVNPVVNNLRSNHLLTEEDYKCLQTMATPEEKMRRLYNIFRYQSDTEKDQFYISLWRYNYTVINNLEKLEEMGKPLAHKTSDEVSQETEDPQMSCVRTTVDNISCKFCGTQAPDSADLVSPVAIGSLYRLELTSPGLYRCQKTGIKFLVKGPVIIKYKLDSWTDHLRDIPGTYEILGPLFNIETTGEPNAVSAVYLPHYLCLKGLSEDTALIKCAHFKDGNLTLETPSQIDPFYITLENPKFSLLGAIMLFVKNKIPIHGMVLIYFTILCKGDPDEEHRIHLYVLPYTANVEETLDKENKKFGFQRIKKPEQTTDTVYTKTKYLVTGDPGVSVRPKTLKFQSEPYHNTEIQLKEKDLGISLYISEEETQNMVWDVHLTQSDAKNITQLLSQSTLHGEYCRPLQASDDHFLDIHRGDLIRMITMVDPVLDDLLSHKLLTREPYNTVRSKSTNQEKMRELYDYISSWGCDDKDKAMKSLRRHNPSLRVWR